MSKEMELTKNSRMLEYNQIVDPINIKFLNNTVASQKEVAEAAQKENNDDNICLGARN